MGIKQIKPGAWQASYSKRNPSTGQPVTLKWLFKTQAAAKRGFPQLIAKVHAKIAEKVTSNWEVLVSSYLEHCRNQGLSESTVYNMEKCLGSITIPRWGKRLITEITTQEIRALIQTEYASKATSYQKSMLKYIRLVFAHGVEIGELIRNPTPKLAFRVGDKIKNCLTEPQVRIFLNKAKEVEWAWYYHCAVAIYTGMRSGELWALTWDKVNFEARQILVDCAWHKKSGIKSTKSGDDRIVEMAPNLVVILKELKLANPHTHFVLPRMKEWDAGQQAEHLRTFLVGIGLPQIRFHDLRASWATILLSKGIVPIKVMRMAGWKDLKTMQIYMRKSGIDIKGMTDNLDLHNPSHDVAKVLNFAVKS